MKAVLQGAARELAAPLLRRLGAIGAAYLVAKGIPSDIANQVTMAAAVLAGLVFDCIVILFQTRGN